MIKRKREVDDELLQTLRRGMWAYEELDNTNLEDWYWNENGTLHLANSVDLEFCSPSERGSQELLEAYNHLVDYANSLRPGVEPTELNEIFSLGVEIPHRVSSRELLVLAAEEDSSEGIERIFKEHKECFEGNNCNRCWEHDKSLSFSEYYGLPALIYALASNPNLDDKQQKRILELTSHDERLFLSFVKNPRVSDETKAHLDAEFWPLDHEDDVTEVLEAMKANPRFTAEEVAEFRSWFEESWGYGQDNKSDN